MIMRHYHVEENAASISLYLVIVNMFFALLRILNSKQRSQRRLTPRYVSTGSYSIPTLTYDLVNLKDSVGKEMIYVSCVRCMEFLRV